MPSLDLDIGVIYTGERALMPRLLKTMAASGGRRRMRLILVDNHSPDGVEPWQGIMPETLVVTNDRRLSYAANMNRILDASDARYVLLMNTDMYFDPRQQCLARMAAFMDAHPDCGLSGCRLYHADGSEAYAARRFQTPASILARRGGLGRLMHGTVSHHLYKEHAPTDTWECDWLSGCFLMVRREAAAEVGRFDETFEKYFEDVDYCLRMSLAGWQVMYHGATSCCHLERRASRNPLSSDAWIHLRAYWRWIQRWGWRPARAA